MTAAPAIGLEGETRWASNFYPSPLEWEGRLYPTVENALQAAKTLDPALRRNFEDCTPSEAKSFGMTVPLRADWDDAKLAIVLDLLRLKFEIPALARRLVATGAAEIVHRNIYGDTFWGICRGQGRNELGQLLMRVRNELVGGRGG